NGRGTDRDLGADYVVASGASFTFGLASLMFHVLAGAAQDRSREEEAPTTPSAAGAAPWEREVLAGGPRKRSTLLPSDLRRAGGCAEHVRRHPPTATTCRAASARDGGEPSS